MAQPTVILDFDGTIADSFALILEVFHDVSGSNKAKSSEEVAYLRNLPVPALLKELEINKWRLPLLLFRGRRRMSERMGEVQLFDDMPPVIEQLHERGYRLFIVSSNSTKNVRWFLRERNLERYFQEIYGGVGLVGKARILRRIMKRNRLQPNECIYIGDEARDIESSKRAGLPCIAVAWGFSDTKSLESNHPYALAREPKQLIELVGKWAGNKAGHV